jgi:arabinofuranan 3-O-arabinosyltransferase
MRGTSTIRPVDVLLSKPDDRPLGTDSVVVSTGHNENAGWTATTPSGDPTPVVLDGWQQGWRTAVGDAAGLSETYRPGTLYRILLIVGALMLAFLAGFCLLPGRDERRWAAVGLHRAPRVGLLTAAAIGVAVLLAGLPGLGASVATVVLVTALRHRRVAAAGIAGCAVGAAVMFAVARPWAGLDSWSGSLAIPQLLALAGVSAMAAVDLRRPTFLSRMKGSSTTR